MDFEPPSNVRRRLDGHEMMLRDAEIARLRGEGVSFREIARRCGCSLGSVQKAVARINKRWASSAATAVHDESARSTDPILRLLTAEDMQRLKVTAEEVSLGLSPLDRYRILGLPQGSGAGDAARVLFDHGRNAEVFDAWMERHD